MEASLQPVSGLVDTQPGVSWAAIAAGAVVTAAVSLLLIAFGAGLGLSSISPWSNTGISASTFQAATGIYLVIVAVMSSAIGGYLAARLRTRWVGLHAHEVYFRDSAHGFLSWAFAAIVSASLLSSATGYLANGATSAAAGAATRTGQSANPAGVYVDRLFRIGANAAAPGSLNAAAPASPNDQQTRAEVLRLWTADFAANKELTSDDKTYVAQLVAARTGLSQADAQKRVDAVTAQAKTDADKARRGAAKLSFWLTAAMLFGAFAASLAAVEGGMLRDGTWNDRVLVPRSI